MQNPSLSTATSARPSLRVRLPVVAALLGLVSAAAGCPGPTMTPNEPVDMGTPSPDMTTPVRYGLIRTVSTTYSNGTITLNSSGASALFADPGQQGAACQRTIQGECTLYMCEGSSFTAPNSGMISISGGTQNVMLMPRTDGSYDPFVHSTANVFPSGQLLTINGAGATVPAFSASITPTAPAGAFTLTVPDGNRANISITLTKSQDYQMTWSALGAGSKVAAELVQNPDNNRSITLECLFDGARGNGTFPSSLLSRFQSTNGQTGVGAFLIGPAVNDLVKQDPWVISVIAIAAGRAGTATLQ